jgi:HTH-type transcriptional regulator / antitoxin HipB
MYTKLNVDEAIKKCPELEKEMNIADMEYQFIKELINFRKQANITQVELAKRSGLTQQMVSKLETYDRVPTLNTLLKYIDCLGLKLKLERCESFGNTRW